MASEAHLHTYDLRPNQLRYASTFGKYSLCTYEL